MHIVQLILSIIYLSVAFFTIVAIVHDRRDPVKTLAWILVICLIPLGGIILYIAVGRNHRKEKLFNRKEIVDLQQIDELCNTQLQYLGGPESLVAEDVARNKSFITLLLNNNKSMLTLHNKVEILNNGDNTFAALFEAIRGAQESIHLEYYIIEYDEIGAQLCTLLAEKAAAGVEVRVIYDDVGSWKMKYKRVKRLRKQGIDVRRFMPVVFPWLSSKVNYRNHRKIAIIDGKIGFTGGINIADRYIKGTKRGPWRDTHLRIEGDAVTSMQLLFATDWYFVSDKQWLNHPKYYPMPSINDLSPMQIIHSGPDSDWASIMQSYFAAINTARKSIYVTTPYFLPNQAILTALKVASLSGKDVRIILPSYSDSKITYWASRSYVGELLEAGVKIYFYKEGFNHSKLIIIDGEFCSVGSANLDIRSFEDNFEVTALMYDPSIAEELTRYFMEDLERSEEITTEAWDARSNLHGLYESISRLFSPLL